MVLRAVPGNPACVECIVVMEFLRAISIAWLSALLHVHLRPIDVMVFHGP